MEWTYIDDKKPEEYVDYWVSCTVNGESGTPRICLAYLEDGIWYFSNDMIARWKDEELKRFKWVPYAYMEYVVPEPAEVREK